MDDLEKVNILLVDDNPANLIALEAALADLGQHLIKAESGTAALRYLLKQDFAVVLLDVQMPNMDGFETATLIRQCERSSHTPIIFITAIGTTLPDVSRGYSVGAVDYIVKPYEAGILKSKVVAFVDMFRMRETVRRQAEELAVTNRHLAAEIAEREQAEEALQETNAELEQRVHERTRELARMNEQLERELAERKRVEEALQQANEQLNGRLDELQRHTREMSQLNELSGQLQSCITAKEAYSIVAQSAQKLFPLSSGTLYMIDPGLNLAEPAASWGDSVPESSAEEFEPAQCYALRRGRQYVVENAHEPLLCASLRESVP